MKRAVFQKFIIILALALFLSGSIFSVTISNIMFSRTKENMLSILRIMDQALEYNKDLKQQISKWKKTPEEKNTRFTIMNLEGDVLVDSEVDDSSLMENHLDRNEIKEALNNGIGYSKRKSETLGIQFIYVSYLSTQGDYILRIAVPYTGLMGYVGSLLPAFLISVGITLLVSLILANSFSKTITRPLQEISEELLKLNEENPEFSFKTYRYEDMNVIADTIQRMAESVQRSRTQIEFEKMIRQEFFSNASHELKTPITSIRGYAELLENDMAVNPEMKKQFISRIKKETENMTILINDILMISRLETKEMEVEITEVRLCPLLQEVCSSLEPLAKECNVTLQTDSRPLSMKANTGQMKEILNNLIINAIKYNKPGGQVKIRIHSENKHIVIIVEDTGVGIPEDAKLRVFERFYRVDKGRSKRVGGTGLGLSIVKHVVNFYNGTIELESKLNVGTKFTIRFPIS